jgi:hypothetical protein
MWEVWGTGEVGIPDRKWPLVRPRCRWEDNIKMDLQDVGWKGMDSFGSGMGQEAGACE